MKTFEAICAERADQQSNNFLLLRLLAAMLVVYGHSFRLAAECASCVDLASLVSRDPEILSHRIGLFIFFVISGFLVTKSCVESRSAASYFAKRALRIFPGLIVCALVMTFVLGTVFTSLSLPEYFSSPTTWRYLLTNATTYRIAGDLPGVALRDGAFAGVINGSLWTIPVEVRLYILVGLAALAAYKSRAALNALAVLLIASAFFDFLPMIAHGVWEYKLAAMFCFGGLVYVNRRFIPYSPALAVALLAMAFLSADTRAFYPLCYLTLAYGTLVIGYGRKLALPRWIDDYSYGVYLYAFPIQQVIAHYLPSAGPYKMFVLAAPLALLAGVLSWRLVEAPAMALKQRIARKPLEPVAGEAAS